jgi:hypothetical protein
MDSCLIRAIGDDFDPNEVIANVSLVPESIYRRGEIRPGRTRAYTTSGISFEIGSGTLVQQIEQAIAFLILHKVELKRLATIRTVESFYLDFSSECVICPRQNVDSNPKDIVMQIEYFPIELIRLAADVGLGISLSLSYPTEDQTQ